MLSYGKRATDQATLYVGIDAVFQKSNPYTMNGNRFIQFHLPKSRLATDCWRNREQLKGVSTNGNGLLPSRISPVQLLREWMGQVVGRLAAWAEAVPVRVLPVKGILMVLRGHRLPP